MPGMLPQDVLQLTGVADPRLSPDGATVAYVVTGLDGETNEYRGAIWLAALDGSSPPRQLTAGARRDADPRWSPDGSRLAFTSNRAGDTMQLYVLPVGGGEPPPAHRPERRRDPGGLVARRRHHRLRLARARRRLRRRGRQAAGAAQVRPPAVQARARRLDRPTARRICSRCRSTAPASRRRSPRGDSRTRAPAWSPDGATLAFVSARHPDWDIEPVTDLYLVDADGADDDEPLRLTQGGGAVELPSWSPQGDRLAVLRYPGVFDDPRHTQVAVVDAQSGAVTLLTRAARSQLRHLPQPARAHLGRRRPRLHRRGPRQRAPLPDRRRRLGAPAAVRGRRARGDRLRRRRRAPGLRRDRADHAVRAVRPSRTPRRRARAV